MNLLNRLPSGYQDVAETFAIYWKAYGKGRALVRSPYLHLAFLISLLSYPLWWNCGGTTLVWYDIVLAVFPNLMGFTLGGYTILLAFGNEEFLKLISGSDQPDKPSPFMTINGAMVHFIILQGLAILIAIFCKAWGLTSGLIAWFGCVFFIYALLTAIGATMAILRMAHQIDIFRQRQKGHDDCRGCFMKSIKNRWPRAFPRASLNRRGRFHQN